MPNKKTTPPPPVPADAPLQRPPESPDFAAPPELLPEAESVYDEEPFETPTYEPPQEGEGP